VDKVDNFFKNNKNFDSKKKYEEQENQKNYEDSHIENTSLSDLLINGVRELGIELDPGEVEKLFSYMDLIKIWNEKFNLTSIDDDREFIIKHFLDSLSILSIIKNIENVDKINMIDIGTGAGFPAIPLKIILKETNITMLDAVDKKVKFLN